MSEEREDTNLVEALLKWLGPEDAIKAPSGDMIKKLEMEIKAAKDPKEKRRLQEKLDKLAVMPVNVLGEK